MIKKCIDRQKLQQTEQNWLKKLAWTKTVMHAAV